MLNLEPLSMKDAEAFWKGKVPLSPGEYNRLTDQQKALAFSVSGIAKGRELSTVMEAMGKASSAGTTFDAFKKDCGGIFERRGFGSWRVETIFRTNIQTAYSVGRYREMMQETMRPLWQYDAINDSRTRPTHAAMDGKVFPADHPFWDTWYPLNGHRCRCGVVTLSYEEAAAEGLAVETDDPTGKLIEPIDPKTGQKMPARPLIPDPGFAYNPGKTVFGGIVDASQKPGRWDAMPGLSGPDKYHRPKLANVRPADLPDWKHDQLLPSGKDNEFYIGEFKKRYGEETPLPLKDPIGDPVILSLRSFLASKKTPEKIWKFSKPGHGESIPLLEDMVLHPFEIWLTPQQNEIGQIRLAKHYVCAWKTPDKQRIGGLAVYEVVDCVGQGVTEYVPMTKSGALKDIDYMDSRRRGVLLFPTGR